MARTAYEADNSSRNRLIKDEARDEAEHEMQDFANTSIRYNKLMKEEDKQYYGVHTPDPVPQANDLPGSGGGYIGYPAGYDSLLGQRYQEAG